MRTSVLKKNAASRITSSAISAAFSALLLSTLAGWLIGCKIDPIAGTPRRDYAPPEQFETTGEEFLISALDEIATITDLAERGQPTTHELRSFNELMSLLPPKERKAIVASTTIDTTFLYGEVTTDGFGAVVSERHAYPKGLLLITVRKTHGKSQGAIVTQTKRYISFNDFLNDSAQQSNSTELYGLSSDTIVTHVLRNGLLETYTFRLPVVTRVVNPQDGSVRVTTRYGSFGAVYSVVRDGSGSLIQIRKNNGLADGSVVAYTQFPDSSWRNVRTVGQADGTVFREITSGP